jgi:shikimate kinase
VGPRCAGKSSAGALLARELGLPFVDADDELAREHGSADAGTLLARLGQARFRKLEAQLLARELERGGAFVLATGGGAVLDPGTRKLLRAHSLCLWLDARPEVLAARLGRDRAPRPPLSGGKGPLAAQRELAKLRAWRRPHYRAVAWARIDSSELTPRALARRLILLLEREFGWRRRRPASRARS